MSNRNSLSRREFVASASGLLLAGTLDSEASQAAAPTDQSELAIGGGQRAVKSPAPKLPTRWGDAERGQLDATLKQESLFYWKGPQTALLLEQFRKVCPVKYAQTCSSGTAALHIAVAASGISIGDEVITSPITDIGTVIGILYQQAVPVFADLGAGTYNLDVADVERRITPRTKAIIAVHLAGNPCDLRALRDLADRRGLVLIEDCAQAWGARYHGQPIGTVGHVACFSLQDSKHITCGDGGLVGSSDERFGPLLQRFGDKGFDKLRAGGIVSLATNYRMSELQAAVAAVQLNRLEAIAATRSRLGNLLTEQIADVPGIVPHQVHAQDRCVYWFYMFRIRPEAFRCNRSTFFKALAAEGVQGSGGYIKVPLYKEPVFQNHAFFAGRWLLRESGLTNMDYTKHCCPEAEAILPSSIRVVIHEKMSEEYILQVAAAIKKVARHYAA